ncbi:caspase family protein [Providencia rettgeri]|uniref:caspase family protein n=1 Tax=Providencia rettgeri TaxID=587 RepID=UPI00226E0D39|nr:caspase family protein [Providencia rettgeri]MCX9115989.1 caspase family protein [Providencia rettgeri]
MSKGVTNKNSSSDSITLGIFIGVSEYDDANYPALPPCKSDLNAMYQVMQTIKKFTKTIKLENEKSIDIKSQLMSLAAEYKGKKIDEIFFYFSGHGERLEDDFYYVLNDFDSKKVNSTGLSETYLDGLVRELTPRVYTKIIDACFSGTKYIKDSTENKKIIIEKKMANLNLENIYYFFSSRENQESYADKKGLSFFTDQLISSIMSFEREIRYVDLSGELADIFKSAQYQQQPIFIMQGSFTESIGKINEKQINRLMSNLGIDDSESKEHGDDVNDSTQSLLAINLDKLIEKSKNNSVDENFILDKLSGITEKLVNFLDEKIEEAYDITIKNESTHAVPNRDKIGFWLVKNTDLFAVPDKSERTVTKMNYVKPDKISVVSDNTNNIWMNETGIANQLALNTGSLFGRLRNNQKKEELVLKEFKEKEKFVSGFSYKCNDKHNIIKIAFSPKHQLLPKVEYWTVFIYSHEKFYIHSLFITYIKKSWDSYEANSNNNWSVSKIKNIKNITQESLVSIICKAIEENINEEINKILQQ